MAQIRIHTERVREVGRQFRAKSEQLNDIDNALQSAIGNLDTWSWDGRSRADAEPMLDQVRLESDRIAQELDRLGQLLERVADRFENEDNNAAQNMVGLPWVDWETSATEVPFEPYGNDERIEELEDIKFQVDLFLGAGATTLEEFAEFMNSLGIVDEYIIEVFYYQDDAVEILSVSEEWSRWIVQIPQTSSLWSNFFDNLGLGAAKIPGLGGEILARLPLIALAADLGLTTWDYSDEGLFSNPEYYAAMATTVGLFVVGAGVATLAAAGLAAAGVVGLPATVAAVAVGVGWAFVSEALKDPIIATITPGFEWAGAQLETAWNTTQDVASDVADWAWDNAQDVANDVAEWTSDAIDWTENAVDDAADWVSDRAGNFVGSLIPAWGW